MQRARRPAAGLFVAVVAVLMVVVMAVAALAITKRVRADGRRWKPKVVDIGRGDAVRWVNPTGRTHDLHDVGSNWSISVVLSPGESVRRVFNKRGTFRFRCVRHSGIVGGKCQGMCGRVVV
jgi:plastocyanin